MRFCSKKETENVIEFIKKYYEKNNLKGAVVGISGGKDSAVVTALLTKALGRENVVGVLMPCENTSSNDMKDAINLCKFYNIEYLNYDLTKTYETFISELSNLEIEYSEQDLQNSNINIKPRLRMATLYYIAAMYSSLKKGVYLVAGTSNKSELFVGYFTKGGDQVHDFEIISDFTVSEVIKIGEYLGVPKEILYKTPSDGISGKTDEESLGISYEKIEDFIYYKPLPEKTKEKIRKLHDSNLHKFKMPKYKRERIGVFVGTFNPIHKGHIHIVKYLLNNEILDKILVIPTGTYWDKTDILDIKNRMEMLKIFKNNNVEIIDKYANTEYTYQVLEDLEKNYDIDKLFLIIGADNIINFDKWKNLDKILEYNIIVMGRDNIDIESYVDKLKRKDNFMIIKEFDYVPVSSTQIRNNISSDIAKTYLDDKVYTYIMQRKLYKNLR